jgi:hypothetical protein
MAVFSILTVSIITIEINCWKAFARCLVVRTVGPVKSLMTLSTSPTSIALLLDNEERVAGYTTRCDDGPKTCRIIAVRFEVQKYKFRHPRPLEIAARTHGKAIRHRNICSPCNGHRVV